MAANGESLSKDLTAEEFARFRDYIHQHSGIFLEEQKTDSLRISLITRATRFELGTLRQYYDMLVTDEEEFKELMNLVTINETSFFRFPAQFEALRAEVVPRILERKSPSSRQFRVWSAGCSTGEEPYSVGMTLLDSGLEGLGYAIEVLGSDVSTNALLRAKEGVYPARGLLSVPSSVSSRFFEATSHGHRVSDRVRRLVTFQYHNLIKEPYPLALMGNWDVIFCRNVTIYFKLESTRRVVHNFYESLNPGGFLFIGHSETLTSISDKFEPVELGGVFLYRKPYPRRIVSFSESLAERERPSTPPAVEKRRRERAQARAVSERAALDTTAAAGSVAEAGSTSQADEVHALLDAAREASANGHTAAVLEAVAAIHAVQADNPQAFLLAAYAHADSGDMEAAIDECHRALAIEPLLPAARYILGIIYQRRDDVMPAINEFKKTLYIDPAFVLAHFSLGNLYRQKGAYEDACREYENTMRFLYQNPDGEWTVFLGGFKPDLLLKTCERSLIECRKAAEDA